MENFLVQDKYGFLFPFLTGEKSLKPAYCAMNQKLWRLFIGILFLLSSSPSFGQKKILLAQDFLKLMTDGKGDTLKLQDVKITTNDVSGIHFWPSYLITPLTSDLIKNLDTIQVSKVLDLKNVEFDYNFTFRKFHFRNCVWLENCDNNQLYFVSSTFDSTFFATSSSKTSAFFIGHSTFNGDVDLNNIQLFHAVNTNFYNRNYLAGEIPFIEFKGCRFEMKNKGGNDFKNPHNLSLRNLSPAIKVSMEIFSSDFISNGKEMGLDLFATNFSYLNLQKNLFQVPVYLYLVQLDKFIVENCQFDKPIDMRDIGLNTNATNIHFSQLTQKIAIKDTFISTYYPIETLYRGTGDEELAHERNFNQLIAVYSKLLGVYKYRGDQKSYNACYIEMKDLTSRKAAFDYRQHPTLEAFFEWRLAQFLKTFCDYGTSPVKSLIFSFYVILAFSFIYFLFPSEEDNLNRRSFSRFLTQAIDYFKTDKQLLDFQVESQEAELKNLQFLRDKLEEARQGTPGVISWIGWPFYAWMSVYHRFMIWFYNRSDLVKGQWSLLSQGRKFWLGFLVSVYFLLFLVSGLFVRILNALALSLNVFVTLGYGEISASGTMRYLAVLEGLLGWFLLSIFSVSLIGQVLQ